jgi:hypothetical protein
MPLPYLWLFAFFIPLSCSVTLLSGESANPRRGRELTD